MTARLYLYRGKMMPSHAISQVTGIHEATIRNRGDAGAPLTLPRRMGPEPKRYDFRGNRLTIGEIMAITGLSRSQVSKRTDGIRFFEREELNDPYADPHPNVVLIFHDGDSMSISDWARRTGISRNVIAYRMAKGWTAARALTTPIEARFVRRTVRIRNRRIIHRIASSFRSATLTGGYEPTFPNPSGTGVGSIAHDLQSGENL